MTPFLFIITSLAVYRITRLWIYDAITEPIRGRIVGSTEIDSNGFPVHNGWLLDHPTKLSIWVLDLITCQWCLSVHVAFWGLLGLSAAGVTGFGWSWYSFAGFVVCWMALSAVAPFWFLIEGLLSPSQESDD